MAKLKKKSRTMAYAEADSALYQVNSSRSILSNSASSMQPQNGSVDRHGGGSTLPGTEGYRAPGSEDQQHRYWAARALQAETMLKLREAHYRDLRNEVEVQTEKREKELALLSRQHQERHTSLERLVYILITVISALIFAIVYQTYFYTWHHHRDSKRSWWSAPAHFTIPILSPFTSVVEHETSVVSSRTIAILICVSGCVIYLSFRYWISRR